MDNYILKHICLQGWKFHMVVGLEVERRTLHMLDARSAIELYLQPLS